MNVILGDKVMMIKGMESMCLVGEMFEVIGITENSIVLGREVDGVAVCAADINTFDQHFAKPKEMNVWTKWQALYDDNYNIYAWYRVRPVKGKVEVKVRFGGTGTFIRKTATCSQGDEFDLEFGVGLAYNRCMKEAFRRNANVMRESMEYYNSLLVDNKNKTNEMISSLYGELEM